MNGKIAENVIIKVFVMKGVIKMGMTIDEALDHLYTYSSTLGSGQTTQAQHEEAKKVAIDVMRKYQKIVQIANDKNINGDLLRMSAIRWLLENGDDEKSEG